MDKSEEAPKEDSSMLSFLYEGAERPEGITFLAILAIVGGAFLMGRVALFPPAIHTQSIAFGSVIISHLSYVMAYGLLTGKSWGKLLAIALSVLLIMAGLFIASLFVAFSPSFLWPLALFILGIDVIFPFWIIKYLDNSQTRAFFKKV